MLYVDKETVVLLAVLLGHWIVPMTPKLATLILSLAIGLAALGGAWGEEKFQPPSVEGAKYLGSSVVDAISEISGTETTVRFYENPNGTRFATMSIANRSGEERIYAYNIDTDGKAPFEFTLADRKGDGSLKKVNYAKYETSSWIVKFHNSK